MVLRRRKFLAVAGAGLGALALSKLPRSLRQYSKKSWALGSDTKITCWHHDQTECQQALAEAFEAIDAIEDVMSLYRPQSQLCRLNAEGTLDHPHPDLVRVLRYAQSLSHKSAGAFDITVQPMWQARQQRETGPQLIGWKHLEVGADRIIFRQAGMQVTLNGVAQGFAADRVAEIFHRYGIQHALIDTGEITTLGKRQGAEAWRVGVQHPRDPDSYLCLTALTNRCLATSGDYASTITPDFSEHHVIDPRTGQSPTELSSVSVAAMTSMEADGLSTATFVLGLEAGMALIERTPGADALMVRKRDSRSFASPGFPTIQSA